MNFLQICRKVREKCGITGTGPAAVTNQTGEMARVVGWVNEAWLEIQNEQSGWDWMRGEFSFDTVIGQQAYAPSAAGLIDHSSWRLETLRSFHTATGRSTEMHVSPMEYSDFRDYYMYGVPTPARPISVAERPTDKALLLGSIPDDVYTIVGEYQKQAGEMAENNDEPSLPSEYHYLIVYGAMQKYAAYENAPEVMYAASRDFNKLMLKLSMNQTGPILFGAPLA